MWRRFGCDVTHKQSMETTCVSSSAAKGAVTVADSIVRIHAYRSPKSAINPYKRGESKKSVGSGFFLPPRSGEPFAVVTCAHVVQEAHRVTLILPTVSSEEVTATVAMIVPKYDLAVVVSDLKELDSKSKAAIRGVRLGDSDTLEPGTHLYAIGFPLGQRGIKVTDGVFSGQEGTNLQHSVPISGGNSGGPIMVRSKGDFEVVGVNSSGIVSRGANNIAYAIPIELLKRSMVLGRDGGVVKHVPAFGVETGNAPKDLVDALHGKGCPEGIYVQRVITGSPADAAGIVEGTIICSFDGHKIDSNSEVRVSWNKQKIGVDVLMHRACDSRKEYVFQVTMPEGELRKLRLRPSSDFIRGPMREVWPPYERFEYVALGGVVMMNLCTNHISESSKIAMACMALPFECMNSPRVVVVDVVAGTMAYQKKGLAQGDLVEMLNGQKVRTLDDVRDALRDHTREFVVWKCRDGKLYAEKTETILKHDAGQKTYDAFPLSVQ